MSRLLKVLILSCYVSLFVVGSEPNKTNKLEDLVRKQKRCFKNARPCVLLLNEKGSVGCAQCESSRVSAKMAVYKSQGALKQLMDDLIAKKTVVLAPESLALPERGLLQALVDSSANPVIVAQQTDYWDENRRKAGEKFPYPPLLPMYSGDNAVPNRDYLFPIRPESSYPSVPFATGVQHARFQFNIFYVPAEDVAIIRDTHANFTNRNEKTAPIFKIESKGRMAACPSRKESKTTPGASQRPDAVEKPKQDDTNSAECLKEHTCLPIGGYSVWSSLSPINETTFNRSDVTSATEIVAVTSPMDSTALFHDLAYGAAGEVASVAALMAIVKSVGDYWRRNSGRSSIQRHPMYFAFNGQSYGFAGSGRFLEDVMNFDCKNASAGTGYCEDPIAPSLKFKALRSANFTVINLGGLVGPTPRTIDEQGNPVQESTTFFIHGFKDGNKAGTRGFGEKVLREQVENYRGLNISNGFRDAAYIDASQSFQYYKADADVLTVTNFERNFTNSFYHSPYDNASLIENKTREPLYNIAAAIAKTVIQLSFGDPKPSVDPEPELINGFIDCLTTKWEEKNCSLAQEYLGEEEYNAVYKKVTGSNYAGVFVPPDFFQQYNPNGYGKALFLQRFMAYHNRFEPTSTVKKCLNNTSCRTLQNSENENVASADNFRSAYCTKGECVLAESHFHAAFGTGLKPKNEARTQFDVALVESSSPLPVPSPSILTLPVKPAWTESTWGNDLEVCYTIQDSNLFGGLVLGSGILTFLACIAFAHLLNPKRKAEQQDILETQNLTENTLP